MQALPCESQNQCKRGKITFVCKKSENVVKMKHGSKKRFNTTAILNSHKERTENLRIIDIANELVEVNDNRKRNFHLYGGRPISCFYLKSKLESKLLGRIVCTVFVFGSVFLYIPENCKATYMNISMYWYLI